MSFENIVTSRELSKKLDELFAEKGIKIEVLFYWAAYEHPARGHLKSEDVPEEYWYVMSAREWSKSEACWGYPAFTAQELWDMIDAQNYQYNKFSISKDLNNFAYIYVNYLYDTNEYGYNEYYGLEGKDVNLANCLAQLIIAMHESKKTKENNKGLTK